MVVLACYIQLETFSWGTRTNHLVVAGGYLVATSTDRELTLADLKGDVLARVQCDRQITSLATMCSPEQIEVGSGLFLCVVWVIRGSNWVVLHVLVRLRELARTLGVDKVMKG